MSKYRKTKAVITEIKPFEHGQDVDYMPVYYKYIVDGVSYTQYGWIAEKINWGLKPKSTEELYIGKEIKILYERDNPSKSVTVYDKNKFNPTLPIIIAAIIFLLCFLVYK